MNRARKLIMRVSGRIKRLVYPDKEYMDLLTFLGIDTKNTEAINEATYFACLKVLREAMGKLPCRVLKRDEKGGVTKAYKHSLYNRVANRPNPYTTASVFWGIMEHNRNEWGNAYALISGAGSKCSFWILEPDKVQIVYDDKKLLGDVEDVYYVYSNGGTIYTFKSEEIIHLRSSMTIDGIEGLRVKDILKLTIEGNIMAQDMLNKSYSNGFLSKAVIQYTGNLNDENVKTYIKGIEDYADSKTKTKSNLIPIPVGSKLEPLNMKLADNEFLSTKKYSALQIASAFGIKPYQIGDYEKSSYSSAEAQQLSFYIDTLLYIIKQYEEELTYKLLSEEEVQEGYFIKFNISVILRADLKTQIETLSKAVSNFIYTPNEARSYLDLPSVPGGDKLLGNGASIPVELAGIQYQKTNGKEE